MNYLFHLLIYLDIYVIVALSLNLVVGYCGMLTLAHAGYFALGGYAYALSTLTLGWSFLPSLVVAILIAAMLSLAVSLPAWRLKGDFFVLGSLAVQALLYSLFYNWFDAQASLGSWSNLTNGPFGITGIPKPDLFGHRVTDATEFMSLATLLTVICAGIFWRLKTSPWGRVLIAMREDGRFESKQKIGMTNRPGWAAYELGEELFVKHFPYRPGATYPDGGCNCEFFTMPGFLEIESLGPLAAVEPEGFAELNESWELHAFAPVETEPELVRRLRELGLEW